MTEKDEGLARLAKASIHVTIDIEFGSWSLSEVNRLLEKLVRQVEDAGHAGVEQITTILSED